MEKQLVASSGDTLDSKVSGRFGHSGYFLVIDPHTLEFEAFPGVGNDEHLSVGRLITPGIKKVIVGNIGPSAYHEVKSSGCTVYLCRNMSVLKAVKMVADGKVSPLEGPTLKDSIHSVRKAGDGYGDQAGGRGKGMGLGLGLRDGSGKGRGMGGGKGRRGRIG